jgi:hypothetical protein
LVVKLACSSTCSSCSGSAETCLTCTTRLASGECATTCPGGTFSASGSCITCHGDCATCSGPSFNQCISCPQDRPVLSDGRCLRTCASKTQFFGPSSSTCQDCDSSCSSCSAAGSSSCLACSDSTATLNSNGECSSQQPDQFLNYLGMTFISESQIQVAGL